MKLLPVGTNLFRVNFNLEECTFSLDEAVIVGSYPQDDSIGQKETMLWSFLFSGKAHEFQTVYHAHQDWSLSVKDALVNTLSQLHSRHAKELQAFRDDSKRILEEKGLI